MDTVDRLAAYLAGELDADERIAIDGELGRDPVLRAQLEALRRADGALAAVRSPELPTGFDRRLRAALDPVLLEVVGDATARSAAAPETGATAGPADELAARRTRRARRNWVPAMVGVAAATAVLVGGGIVAGLLQGDDDGEASVAMDAMESLDEEAAEDDAGAADGSMTLESAPATSDGPTVVVSERELTPVEADALLGSVELEEVAGRGLDEATGAMVATRWRAALTGTDADVAADSPQSDADDDMADDGAFDSATERQVLGSELTGEHEEAIARCLDGLPVGAADAIPVYVEVADFEGEPVLVFGLVARDPVTGAYTAPQALVLARADCRVLRSAQG